MLGRLRFLAVVMAILLASCRSPLPSQAPAIHGLSASLLPDVTSLAIRDARGSFVVLASTDLHDLRAIIAADADTHQFDWRDCETRKLPIDRQECWLDKSGPANSLLIAAHFIEPCVNSDVAFSLHGATLNITGTYTPIDCGGAGSLPEPTFSVVALPLNKLPNKLMTIVFDDGNGPVETMVDLRQPALSTPSPAQRFGDESSARKATLAALSGKPAAGTPDELAILRWPDGGSGCQDPASDGAYGDAGYILRFRISASTHEYRWRSGRLIDCGTVVP